MWNAIISAVGGLTQSLIGGIAAFKGQQLQKDLMSEKIDAEKQIALSQNISSYNSAASKRLLSASSTTSLTSIFVLIIIAVIVFLIINKKQKS